jgi:hypothetical protein
MSLIAMLVFIAIAAVIVWAIGRFPAMDPVLKQVILVVIYVAVAIVFILWIASIFGYHTPNLHVR